MATEEQAFKIAAAIARVEKQALVLEASFNRLGGELIDAGKDDGFISTAPIREQSGATAAAIGQAIMAIAELHSMLQAKDPRPMTRGPGDK